MKKTVTYKQIYNFDTVAMAYLTKEGFYIQPVAAKGDEPAKPGKYTDAPLTKLATNIKKVIKQTDALYEEFNEKKTDIFLDAASVDDKTKVILYDDVKDGLGNISRNYRFTVEKQKEVNKKIKELMNREVEIHVRITEGEWKLTDEEREAFNGIVIPEFTPEEETD